MRPLFYVLAPLAVATAMLGVGCKEEGTVQVHRLTFVGVHSVNASALQNVLATRQNSTLPWGPKHFFDRSQFDADLARIRAFYEDRGYPDARVTGFDVKLNNAQDRVDVTVNIDEGQPLRIASIDFEGFEAIPNRRFSQMRKQVPLGVGSPRDRQQVVTTHELAINELRDVGYAYAKVAIHEDPGPTPNTVALTFSAEPGKVVHFGPIEVAGAQSVGEDVVRRELAYREGGVYRRSQVQETQRRIYEMQLFRFVSVQQVDPEAEPSEVPTRITVAEGRHYRVKFGGGYGTEEKVRAEADYHHFNFLGGARSAGALIRWSSLDRGIRLDATQPYFFHPHLSLSGEAQQWYSYTPAYNAVTSGGKATLTYRLNARNAVSASLVSEHDRSAIAPAVQGDPKLRNNLIALGLDPGTGAQTGNLNALSLDAHRSTADNVLNARRGYQISLHGELAGGFLPGSFDYQALSADVRHYLPLGSRFVVADRVQIGNLNPVGGDRRKVPFSKKYFLGGATSIRGWGVYEVSPLSDSGLPIGGNSMFAFSSELRAGIQGNLGAVLFFDAGNVWAASWDQRLGDLRYAVGTGLRYQTPVGPARFDVGYQLNPIPGLLVNGSPQHRRWRVHFSIGQAF